MVVFPFERRCYKNSSTRDIRYRIHTHTYSTVAFGLLWRTRIPRCYPPPHYLLLITHTCRTCSTTASVSVCVCVCVRVCVCVCCETRKLGKLGGQSSVTTCQLVAEPRNKMRKRETERLWMWRNTHTVDVR